MGEVLVDMARAKFRFDKDNLAVDLQSMCNEENARSDTCPPVVQLLCCFCLRIDDGKNVSVRFACHQRSATILSKRNDGDDEDAPNKER